MGIGERLSEIITEKGLNTNELALKIGVPPTTLYSIIKRDSSRMEIDLIIKIAHALDMTADELLVGETSRPEQAVAAHFDGDDLTPEERQEVENFINYVKSKRKD